MRSGFRTSAVLVLITAASLVIHADDTPASQSAEIQLQLGSMLSAEGRYNDSLDAYQNALKATDSATLRSARAGVITTALRVAEFDLARHEAETLVKEAPRDASAVSLYADSRWAAGLFEEAEARYRDALALTPDLPRGLHGVARSLLARNQLDEALEPGAGGAAPRAARPRDSPYRRRHLRADAQVRGGRVLVRQLREPAAGQGPQREGGVVARGNPIPALIRAARAVSGRARHRRHGVHGGFPHA